MNSTNQWGAQTQGWLLTKASISDHGASVPVDIPDFAGAIGGGGGHEVPTGVPGAAAHGARVPAQGQDAAAPRQVPDPHRGVPARRHQLRAAARGTETALRQGRGETCSSKII